MPRSQAAPVAIDGEAGADTITVNTTGANPLTLDGKGSGDEYIVNFSSGIGPILSEVNIADSGTSGSNQAVIDGTPAADTFNVSETQTVLIGGQTVAYTSNLQQLTINGLAGLDVFNVTPSRYAAIVINGGSPWFGLAGVPPGDILNFNPLGNTFSQNINTFYTNGGSPRRTRASASTILSRCPSFRRGRPRLVVSVPGQYDCTSTSGLHIGPAGPHLRLRHARSGLRLGRDGTENLYWPRRRDQRFADFLFGGAWGTSGAAGSATFKADVANGWYLVSVKMGEIIAHNGMQIVEIPTPARCCSTT